MKSLTFAEFFAMPPGTIFGQATGLPHERSTGLYRKGKSWDSSDENEYGDAESASIDIEDVLFNEDGEHWVKEDIYPGELEDDHRFLIYEPADLDRLAGLIGRGRGWGLADLSRPVETVDIMEMPEGEPSIEVYEKIKAGWLAWVEDPAPKLDRLRLSIWPGRATAGSVELVLAHQDGPVNRESSRTLYHPENDFHDNLSEVVFQSIDIMHNQAISHLRNDDRKNRPKSGCGWGLTDKGVMG